MFSVLFSQLAGVSSANSIDMADTAAVPPTIRSSKRKRNQISYALHDVEIYDDDDDDDDDDDVEAVNEDNDSDNESSDDEYSPKRRGKKAKARASKKPKLNLASKPKKPEKPFPFMMLPAELRDYIYDLALVDPNGLQIFPKTKRYRRTVCRGQTPLHDEDGPLYFSSRPLRQRRRGWRGRAPKLLPKESDMPSDSPDKLVPNLLAVNKQIHAEAASTLYMQQIIVEDTLTLHHFLAAIGPVNMKLLTDVTVRSWGSGRGTHKAMNYCAFVLLAGATNLKSLFLDCRIGYFRYRPVLLARQLYRDCHVFFEAYGTANGRKDAVVDILEVHEENFDRQNGHYAYWRNRTLAEVPEVDKFKADFQAELRKLLGC